MRVSKRLCDDLSKLTKDEISERPRFWDESLPGFGVRVNAGGSLSFLLKYRVKGDARQRLAVLGTYPTVEPDAARTEAVAIKAAAQLGQDLLADRIAAQARASAERQEANRGAVHMTDLLDGWRLTIEADLARRQAGGESLSHDRELLRLEAKVLRPEFGVLVVSRFDPERFQALIDLQPGASSARNLRTAIMRFARFANADMTRRGLAVRWPVTFTVTKKVRSRTHWYNMDEAARLYIAAGTLGRRGALLRWMLLTGCRRIEAQQVLWDHIIFEDDHRGAHWAQPGHMTKNGQPHRVPLSAPAVALLRWLPQRESRTSGPSPLIFAGRGGLPVGGWTDVRRALLTAAGIDTGTLHDFRRTLVSTLGDHGFDPQVADALLNHSAATSMGGVMAVYQRSDLWGRRREAIELWTSLLMAAVAKRLGCPAGDERAWGLSEPFRDARIIRPDRPKPPAVAAPGRRGKPAGA